jgi:hypothetical protein
MEVIENCPGSCQENWPHREEAIEAIENCPGSCQETEERQNHDPSQARDD